MTSREIVELIASMMKQGFGKDDIVDELLSEGLVKDEEEAGIIVDMVFTYYYVANELSSGKSEEEVKQELINMGVPERFAERYIMEFRMFGGRV